MSVPYRAYDKGLRKILRNQPTNMIKTTDLSDAQLDALIHHYKRIRERIADNATAMTRLEALVAEKTDRITAILNDEVTTNQ